MSAIPENLAEAELFGHEKGAFTGAEQARAGFFAEAEGGTLFLDELGLLPPALQPKLLRVLQDGEYIPVGSRKPRKANVRVVAATNEDLGRAREGGASSARTCGSGCASCRCGSRRSASGARTSRSSSSTSSRSTRSGSRPPAARSPTPRRCARSSTTPGPGNIRELEHAIERGLLLARGDAITLADLPPELAQPAAEAGRGRRRGALPARARRLGEEVPRGPAARGGRAASAKAAELAGLHRSTLYEKLARYGLVEKDAKA